MSVAVDPPAVVVALRQRLAKQMLVDVPEGRRDRGLTAIEAGAVARLDVALGPVPTIALTIDGEAVAVMPLAQLDEGERRNAEWMLRGL
jgi:hypothetical protein